MSPIKQSIARAHTTENSFTAPYAPSWFDRFTAWVESLPGPAWAFYLFAAAVVVLVESAVQWREGAYPAGSFLFLHVWSFSFFAYMLLLMHYLDKLAASALATFRPMLTTSPAEMEPADDAYPQLLYRLTTLPGKPTAWATFIGAAIAITSYLFPIQAGFEPHFLAGTAGTAFSDLAFMLIFVPANAIAGVLLYHTIHQLVIISRIYTRQARISLYQLQPLYALSRPGVITALGLSGVVYLFFLTTPEMASGGSSTRPLELVLGGIFSLIAGLTFILPLWGAHRRIGVEKSRRIGEVTSRFEAATVALHRDLDGGQLATMSDLNKALTNLGIEHEFIKKIPTWPWDPNLTRSLIFALLIPITTWVLQLFLGRVLGG
jgi:hypothetical protein